MRTPLLASLALATLLRAAPVTIRNDVPRVDSSGNIISAGDGCISYHPDLQRYYLFGAHYQPCAEPNTDCYAGAGGLRPCQQHQKVPAGSCCGWRNATIAAWSSPDLVTWDLEGLNILPILTSNASAYSSEYMAVFEPCGVFNRETGFWSLFFLRDGYVLARAVARTAAGPFNVLQWDVPIPGMSRIVDFYFWQNATTGALIMKHNSQAGGEYAVTFSDDYLNVTGTSPIMGHELGYTEGGGIFQHGGDTFLMAGYGCCFCTLGSNGFLWRSPTVLGNYTFLGDKVPRFANKTSVTHAQQFSVTPVYTSGGVVPMFIGIRFGSAPDFIKSHDFQYWYPLSFDGSNDMLNVTWVDSFSLDLAPPPPPPPVHPPAPWFACSLLALGACVEVPAGAPGANSTQAACEAECAPWFACTPTSGGGGGGACQPVPARSPGAQPTAGACAAACVLCDVSGDWVGSEKAVGIRIAEGAVAPNHTAAIEVYTAPAVWGSNATGAVYAGGLQVSGGFCGGVCSGTTGPLRPGGPPCALIDWGAEGTWCKPAADPTCT